MVEHYTTMTEFEEGWPYPVAFPPSHPSVTLPSVLAERGARQLHVAETEKYPHVTYFFGGGEEAAHEGERRELVDSPRDVPTYDKKPEMSAREAAAAFVSAWREDSPVFGIINFANSGHGGPHRRDRGRGDGDRDRRRVPGRGRARRFMRPAAPASSPPITATRITCSRTTAAPTPPTRSIPSR